MHQQLLNITRLGRLIPHVISTLPLERYGELPAAGKLQGNRKTTVDDPVTPIKSLDSCIVLLAHFRLAHVLGP